MDTITPLNTHLDSDITPEVSLRSDEMGNANAINLEVLRARREALKAELVSIDKLLAAALEWQNIATASEDDQPARADLVAQILGKTSPLRIPSILRRLTKMGHPVETSSPYRTLFKLLSADPRFQKADRGEWKLAEKG
jgi:hypothetical protein